MAGTAFYRSNKKPVNRGLQFMVNPTTGTGTPALLARPGTSTALTSMSWEIAVRVAIIGNTTGYLFSRAVGDVDEYCFYYASGFLHFFANGNNIGTIDLAFSITTPPGSGLHTAVATYDGATVRVFLDGMPAGSVSAPALSFPATAGATLAIGVRNDGGGGATSILVDYLRIIDNREIKVLLALDEAAPGPYLNTGTAGGQLAIGTPAPVSVNL